MTYQELVKNYPWVDLAWEVFKGISPVVLSLLTIFWTEYFIRKRENIFKKRQMIIEYLEKILLWIHETRRDIFEISHEFSNVLSIKSPIDRTDKYNEIMAKITEMNKAIFIYCETYKDISVGLGYDFKLDNYRGSINFYSFEIDKIGCRYLNRHKTDSSIDEINLATERVSRDIQLTSNKIVEQLHLLYGKRKRERNFVLAICKRFST